MSGLETMRPVRLLGLRYVAVGIFCALVAIALLIVVLGHRPANVISAPGKVVSVPTKAIPVAEVSGKNWRYELNFPLHNPSTVRRLIQCESKGLNISRADSNGHVYLGVLQFNGATWNEMEQRFNFHGDPRNPPDAIHMADMMISSGLIEHWGCARSDSQNS